MSELRANSTDPVGRVIDVLRERDAAIDRGIKVYSWPLSKGVTAEVRLVGAEIKPQHLRMLQQYLTLAQEAWEMDADDGSPPPDVPTHLRVEDEPNDEAPE